MLSLRNLKIRTSHCISANAESGSFIALMGVNGAGKSTLLYTMAGLLRPVSGTIFIDDQDVYDMSAMDRAKKIAMLSTERSETLSLSVREMISLGRNPYTDWSGRLSPEDKRIIAETISCFELEKFSDRNVSKLSDGERQRGEIARVVSQRTKVLLLDEPLSHLDIPWQLCIMKHLRRIADEGGIVVAALHELEHAIRNVDKIWLLCGTDNKQFYSGSPKELLEQGILNDAFKEK
jgi:iron complex transport system ATP-binding protein